jgi:hypothetical protein
MTPFMRVGRRAITKMQLVTVAMSHSICSQRPWTTLIRALSFRALGLRLEMKEISFKSSSSTLNTLSNNVEKNTFLSSKIFRERGLSLSQDEANRSAAAFKLPDMPGITGGRKGAATEPVLNCLALSLWAVSSVDASPTAWTLLRDTSSSVRLAIDVRIWLKSKQIARLLAIVVGVSTILCQNCSFQQLLE